MVLNGFNVRSSFRYKKFKYKVMKKYEGQLDSRIFQFFYNTEVRSRDPEPDPVKNGAAPRLWFFCVVYLPEI